MSNSISPDPGASDSKSPLSALNLGFLKNLTEKKTTRDGQQPKRRGPKPDSKPALTRRQELNRQAQRTHRERKELYIKALEDEVLRLKEIYSHVSQDKEKLAQENRQLKALLAQHGISPGAAVSGGGAGASMLGDESTSNNSRGFTPSGSVSGAAPPSSYTSAFTPPHLASTQANSLSPHPQGHPQQQSKSIPGPSLGLQLRVQEQNRNPHIDYEQAGIDFVLTLEKPCMDHMPWLVERGMHGGENEACGHALMASCPPAPFPDLTDNVPFGYTNVPDTKPVTGLDGREMAQRTWELTKGDLNTLLDLSKRLNLDGEITPIMAWGMVLAHPRLAELKPEDFTRICDELGSKVRCYGFGAVMEEFEVRDALENVFSTKSDVAMAY